ncbi:MAG TPA: YggS family pyridoxal phosphate-dependent enzyme [Armatimonadota bacterium]|nr:YggS family pyridoxal phosphate-dependent enzyme [Armatimonadota bacterium]
MKKISARLAAVRAEMADAARRAGRRPEDVRLVAVTKTHPPAVVAAAVAAGVTAIGENYLQEADEKFTALGWPDAGGGAPAARHFIGHLQANKARKAARWFEYIETVDSAALAARLDRLAEEQGRRLDILLQINISGEDEKSGISPHNVEGVLATLAKLAHIQVRGLMTIGRFVPDPEAARAEFRALRELRDALRAVAPPTVELEELSMGMSHDFAVAIEEGATIVRVGSRLFGPRHG